MLELIGWIATVLVVASLTVTNVWRFRVMNLVGAVLATGYNGAPAGTSHCLDIGCLREKLGIPSGERHELCRGLHAEQNAIIQAAKHGTSIEGSTLYCNTMPCIICSKMVINAGIKRVVYLSGYPDQLAEDMIRESGVIVEKYEVEPA